MFISGNGVSRTGTEDNILSGTDLSATIAGVSLNEYNDT
tara:strand:- start:277 stop:393 length:117 start_codon:yes stop_codon:yes gene_type:complete